jgi:hypothetical protein
MWSGRDVWGSNEAESDRRAVAARACVALKLARRRVGKNYCEQARVSRQRLDASIGKDAMPDVPTNPRR